MKKIISIVLIAVMALGIFTSCGSNKEIPNGMKYACNTDIVDYSFFVPESWIVDATEGYSMAHVSKEDRSSVSVLQFNFTSDIRTIDDWWDKKDTNGEASEMSYKSKLSNTLKEVNIIEEGKETSVDGVAAKSYLFTGKELSSGIEYKFFVTAVAKNGSVYIITFTSTDTNNLYEKNISTVKDKILANFRFN